MEIDCNNSFSSKDSKKHSIIFSGIDCACTAITSVVLYWLFSKFTSDSYFYNGISCNKLLATSQKLESFYYYLFITYLIMLAMNIMSLYHKAIESVTECTRLIVLLFSFFLGLFFLIKVTTDINLGENCGQLRCLALVVATVGWIGITLLCCLLCVTLATMVCRKN